MKATYLETKNLASQFARPNPLMDSYVTFGQYTQTNKQKNEMKDHNWVSPTSTGKVKKYLLKSFGLHLKMYSPRLFPDFWSQLTANSILQEKQQNKIDGGKCSITS